MTDEKQIEEMARILCRNNCTSCTGATCLALLNCKALYEHGYRKLPENAVVIPEKITEETSPKDIIKIAKYNEKVRKETVGEFAKDLLQELDLVGYDKSDFCVTAVKVVAKQYGVEVEE